ncbi:MAG: acetyltransferase-like isoleucine patch superfamily enzyme [Crocinitomicaceae bacterium]|jgi:acetyltransferase-like isoleucine patch superfamily enzyme
MKPLTRLKLAHKYRRLRFFFRSRPSIKSEHIELGKNVIFGKNVQITAKHVKIGDGCVINDNVIISGNSFDMGDYGTIYHNCFFPGGDVKIGHNFWIGNGSIVDGRAGTTIGNNVGIGAQSQLWTHMMYGDVMYGCRFHSEKALEIGNDVWLTGHNLVSPVKMEDRSLAMFGSLITKDMEADKTYAGSPAKEITDKVGAQFKITSFDERNIILQKYLSEFSTKFGLGDYSNFIKVSSLEGEAFDNSDLIQINYVNRTYKKTGTVLEYYLMRFLLPDIKLIPVD